MHVPVMLSACLSGLITDPDGIYVDGTLGNGGHSEAILARLGVRGRLIGFDRDVDAISRVEKRLGADARFTAVHDNYAAMADRLNALDVGQVHGVLLDLGVSSNQLGTPERGFSFMQDGPLDMRMNQTTGIDAKTLVNEASEAELADIIFKYGEERQSRRIARAIVEARKDVLFSTTLGLAEVVERAKGGKRGRRIHPATQTFQALRMAVNDELGGLERVLETMLSRFVDGGRFVILTFHSLEDRLVKQFFNRHVPQEISLQQGGVELKYEAPAVRWISKKPLTADEQELRENPRSRSAKLRVVEVREV